MLPPQIRCYHSSPIDRPFVFFLLCKGDNAGKPALKPWVNSFSVQCNCQQSFNFYYWLLLGLFQAGKFKTHHRGTAIQFINLQDVRDIIKEVAPPIFTQWSRYQQIVAVLNKLDQLKASHARQLLIAEQMQKQIIAKFLSL